MEKELDELELKLLSGYNNFTEDELSDLAYEYPFKIEYGEDRRWSKSATSIINVKDKFFAIDWDKGLTEYQEDCIDSQPYEVIEQTEVKTIIKYIKK